MSAPLYAVYGGSGFGREVLPLARMTLAERMARDGGELVVVDDVISEPVNGHRALTYSAFLTVPGAKHMCIAIADAAIRRRLAERCTQDGVAFFSVIAPNAVILDNVVMGEGAIVCSFVTMTSDIRIGAHFHANIYSYVAHDCRIGDFVTFAPAVKCNGNTVVEDAAYLGTGAVLRQGTTHDPLRIGAGAVVGMGAVVTRSVDAGVTVVGNPARPISRS